MRHRWLIIAVLVLALTLCPALAFAATKYITSAGGGDFGGSNWTNAMPWATAIGAGGLAAGDVGYVSGSIARTTSGDTIANAGTQQSPIRLVGCTTSSDTDGYQGRSNAFGALVTTNMPALSYSSGYLILSAYVVLENFNITFTSKNSIGVYSSSPGFYVNCSITNSTNNSSAGCLQTASGDAVINCDLVCSGAAGAQALLQGSNSQAIKCRLSCTGGTAFRVLSGSTGDAIDCLIYGSTIGVDYSNINTATSARIINCTIQGCTTVFKTPNSNFTSVPRFINCMVTDSTTAWDSSYAGTNPLALIRYNNRTRDNTTLETAGAFTNWATYLATTTDTGGAETDYINAGAGDFRLIAASPGAKAGVPTGDIGAVQRLENYPAASDVWHGVTYGAGGTEYTGTKVGSSITNLSAGNVKSGVVIDDVTGTYAGSGGGMAEAFNKGFQR